jgi:AcrR family transcriptional regulator
MNSTRTYRMDTRALAMAATRERIVDAAADAFSESWYEDVTVRAVAAAAGVALQTVQNHFPTKDDLFVAAAERITSRIASVRWNVEPGDVEGGLSTLLDDYERTGDSIMRMLAVEPRVPTVQPHVALGRRKHEEWVERVFAALLTNLRGVARRRRVAQLVVITDVYTWKLLRRDKGLGRKQTIEAMRELVLALDTGGGPE